MICRKCFNEIEAGALFCPFCGTRIQDMIDSDRKSAAVEDVFGSQITDDPAGAPQPAQYRVPAADTHTASPAYTAAEMPAVPAKPDKPAKEKEFFGAGAFALCLVVIALLAGSTGVFAGLYFSLIGAI